MNRREFITLLGGAAAWPLAARAQQGDRLRRIGVLMPFDENDPLAKPRLSALTQALAGVGWTVGRNVRMDLRGHGGDANRIPVLARELVGLQRDISGRRESRMSRCCVNQLLPPRRFGPISVFPGYCIRNNDFQDTKL